MGNLIDDNLYACPATTKRHITDQWSGIRIASSLISIVALVIFALALSMPAARYQVDWLDGPISNNVVSGWALFKLTVAILMPVWQMFFSYSPVLRYFGVLLLINFSHEVFWWAWHFCSHALNP